MSQRLILEGELRRPRFHLDLALDLDLSVPLGIFGATGAGKTTLLRIIAGLEPAFRGHGVDCRRARTESPIGSSRGVALRRRASTSRFGARFVGSSEVATDG